MQLNLNYLQIVNPAVDNGLKSAGLADTPVNRIKVLKGIHDEFVENPQFFGPTVNNGLLLAIENEVKRLEGLSD